MRVMIIICNKKMCAQMLTFSTNITFEDSLHSFNQKMYIQWLTFSTDITTVKLVPFMKQEKNVY